MADLTRAQAQDKAVKALNYAESHVDKDYNLVRSFSLLATAWATLAGTLPEHVSTGRDRPFDSATSR